MTDIKKVVPVEIERMLVFAKLSRKRQIGVLKGMCDSLEITYAKDAKGSTLAYNIIEFYKDEARKKEPKCTSFVLEEFLAERKNCCNHIRSDIIDISHADTLEDIIPKSAWRNKTMVDVPFKT